MIRPTAWCLMVVLVLAAASFAATGDTRVCRWKDDKQACYTFVFDDGCPTQLDEAVPEFLARGMTNATFWLNPGTRHFTIRVVEWVGLVNLGFDFANHGMNHTGGPTYDSCDYQIGEAAKRIRTWNKKPFMLWHQGGGTVWPITDEQKVELLVKHGVHPHWDLPGRGVGTRDGGNTSRSASTLKGYVDACLADGDWHWTLFHGIDGDWTIQDKGPFVEMLDYLKAREDRMWFPTCTNAHKYKFGRMNSRLSVVSASAQQVELSLEFAALNCDPVDVDYLQPGIYDQPLTLVTEVPAAWGYCRVAQGGAVTVHEVTGGEVMYEARPGMGAIVLTESGGTPVARGRAEQQYSVLGAQSHVNVSTVNGVPWISVHGSRRHAVSVVDARGGRVAQFDGDGSAVYQLAARNLASGAYVVRVVADGRTTGVPLIFPGAR